jgi:hypothetical protein
MELWRSVTDREYNKPLLEKPDSNIEVIEQAAEQFAVVSRQVDGNTQGMFILPWSGQTGPPASGVRFARTILTGTRTGHFEVPLFFTPGEILVQHRLNDYGEHGPQDVTTNRLYIVEEPAAFGVGEAGPIEIRVVAVNPGPGYNRPEPETLRTILQPGVGFNNLAATVENGSGSTNRVIATIFPDVPITKHVGQYLLFTLGANTGQYRRIVGIENPNPTLPHGGVFNLAAELILTITGLVGTFAPGERISQPASGAEGQFISLYGGRLVILRTNGTFNGVDPIQGELGATATVTGKEQNETLVPEVSSAGWRIMRWFEDLTVSVTNETFPTGGECGFLDELGNERGLPRFTGESDDEYRRRIAVPADVVSPGAVIRAGNKVLEPLGEEVCLREVGRPLLPGMFYDGAPNQLPFAYDLDLVEMAMLGGNLFDSEYAAFFDAGDNGFFDNPAPFFNTNFYSLNSLSPGFPLVGSSPGFIPGELVSTVNTDGVITTGIAQFDYVVGTTQQVFRGVVRVRGPGFAPGQVLRGHVSGFEQTIVTVGPGLLPQHRFYVYLSLREFRGFFLVGVPRVLLQDFGMFYDLAPNNAFDTNVLLNFYDGTALGSNSVYARIYEAVDNVRPAGVPFDLYIEELGCF